MEIVRRLPVEWLPNWCCLAAIFLVLLRTLWLWRSLDLRIGHSHCRLGHWIWCRFGFGIWCRLGPRI